MENQNLYLTISTKSPKITRIEDIMEVIKSTCVQAKLCRLDERSDNFEISLLVEFENLDQLIKTKDKLIGIDNNINISFLDNKGIN